MRDITQLVIRQISDSETTLTVQRSDSIPPSSFLIVSAMIVTTPQFLQLRERIFKLQEVIPAFQKPTVTHEMDYSQIERETMCGICSLFIAGKRKEIEKLKTVENSKTETAHVHQVLACLYTHLEALAKVLKTLQLAKRRKAAKAFELEKARNSVLGVSEIQARRPVVSVQVSETPDLQEENQQLLQELQATDSELVLEIQKSVQEINSMLSSFSLKVVEHEQTSQRSKNHAVCEQAEASLGYMKEATKQLESANELSKGVGLSYFLFFLALASFLLFYDWWSCETVVIRT